MADPIDAYVRITDFQHNVRFHRIDLTQFEFLEALREFLRPMVNPFDQYCRISLIFTRWYRDVENLHWRLEGHMLFNDDELPLADTHQLFQHFLILDVYMEHHPQIPPQSPPPDPSQDPPEDQNVQPLNSHSRTNSFTSREASSSQSSHQERNLRTLGNVMDQPGPTEATQKALGEKDVENICAEQIVKMEQLNLHDEDYKLHRGCSPVIGHENVIRVFTNVVEPMQTLKKDERSSLQEVSFLRLDNENQTDIREMSLQKETEDNKSMSFDMTVRETRGEIESLGYTKNLEKELRSVKKVTEELDAALDRSIVEHARIVEHCVELQEKHNKLLGRHENIMGEIAEVKKATAEAGTRSNSFRFVKSFAAESSVSRVEKEKEEKQLNKNMKMQLRDTTEAVHTAGELLVQEAKHDVSAAEENRMETLQFIFASQVDMLEFDSHE